ncbi:MAG: hypothetical protein M3Q33_00825 [Acidobacteriota bacterium]|nr:hypothetical protein [Acidobacteriota bacterium]
MNWKEVAKKELNEVIELADYDSTDDKANERLKKIKEKAKAALKEIEKI